MGQGEATIIAAIIAAGASIISAMLSFHSVKITKKLNKENIEASKEISKTVQEAEDKRTEVQIDANIVWNARVEWIQNVRRVTADFITACYEYVQTDKKNEEEQKKNLDLIQQNKSLLILYFGPDTKSTIEQQDILNLGTNEAKNNEIVDLINTIFDQAKKYFSNKELQIMYVDKLNQCIECEDTYIDDGIYLCQQTIDQDECKERQKGIMDSLNDCEQENKDFLNNIDLLSEAMRIYLKLEWNKAKNRTRE